MTPGIRLIATRVPRFLRRRPMALTVARASKAMFVALVLSHGGRFPGYHAGIDVVAAANNYLLPAWMIGFGLWLVVASRAERLMPADV